MKFLGIETASMVQEKGIKELYSKLEGHVDISDNKNRFFSEEGVINWEKEFSSLLRDVSEEDKKEEKDTINNRDNQEHENRGSNIEINNDSQKSEVEHGLSITDLVQRNIIKSDEKAENSGNEEDNNSDYVSNFVETTYNQSKIAEPLKDLSQFTSFNKPSSLNPFKKEKEQNEIVESKKRIAQSIENSGSLLGNKRKESKVDTSKKFNKAGGKVQASAGEAKVATSNQLTNTDLPLNSSVSCSNDIPSNSVEDLIDSLLSRREYALPSKTKANEEQGKIAKPSIDLNSTGCERDEISFLENLINKEMRRRKFS
eukprot:CAMPEP_0170518400 /NCGR_PEP_ID=MMETSP0209-20121228/4097_1 /TAXON_ID=665100 ORGANISM="Litonotus pictus, Strain P1" /NCGR_SAMPLE_ID=MMETSP0209 /ASSEMBLY_ACC=CAM_ASM_000301 /LENGTH=313 /DNA_ID=CAMNT_0010803947 /DNA_START=2158 /DNA_END=3096 /DNA_ORIENTATION=+